MSTTCHEGHVATVESRLSSPRPAPGTGETRQNHDLHLWNLHDMHNQNDGHLINELQLENLYVFLNSQDHRNLHLHKTEMSTTIKELPLRNLCNSTLSDSKHLLLTTMGMSSACPRTANHLGNCTACITGTSTTCTGATGETLWSAEQQGHVNMPLYRDRKSTTVMNCNCGNAKQCTALSGPRHHS